MRPRRTAAARQPRYVVIANKDQRCNGVEEAIEAFEPPGELPEKADRIDLPSELVLHPARHGGSVLR